MVQVAPVEYPKLPFEFDYLRVERIGGIAGVHERLEVAPREAQLGASVQAHVQDPREFLLDAAQAQHVLETVQPLAAAGDPPEPEAPRGADMYGYVVEVGWGGMVRRYEVQGVPSDDALHGVLEFAAAMWAVQDPTAGSDPGGPVTSRPD